jgi:hypothetical protein
MNRARILLLALIVTTMTVVTSCSDQGPVGLRSTPQASQAPKADLVGGLLGGVTGVVTGTLKTVGLLSCAALPYDSVTQVIGREGGVMHIGPHVFTVPGDALKGPVAITAVIPANQHANVIRFQPDGLQFATPAALQMSYANCNLLGKLLPKRIARVDDLLHILDYLLSLDNLFSKYVTGEVPHFTGYAVAW